MIEFRIYSIVLLLEVFLLLQGMLINKKIPTKIKYLVTIVYCALSLRYISLFTLFLSKNIKHLFVFKPFVFLNVFAIPVIAIICFYIFIRNNKINFNYLFIFSTVIFFMYLIIVFKYDSVIKMSKNYGYIIGLLDSNLLYWMYLIINTIFLLGAIYVIVNPNANKFGLVLVIVSAIIAILDISSIFVNHTILPNNILSDLIWTITMVYAINKVKK